MLDFIMSELKDRPVLVYAQGSLRELLFQQDIPKIVVDTETDYR